MPKKSAKEKGEFFYSHGYNCAKSSYLATMHALGRKPDLQIVKACSAFGGGIGRSGSVCGALVGSELALGQCLGTAGGDNPSSTAYVSAAGLYSKFKAKFGSVECNKLNRGDFESDAHFARCSKIVAYASAISANLAKRKKNRKK